jgi:CRISPR-associated protein Csx17
VTRHVLTGLRPEPLGAYLVGLGLIRLLGEQADPSTAAAWSPDGLVIESTVDEIARWLVDGYVPTPVLSPWNEGSGFGAKDRTPKETLDALLSDSSPRLAPFRAAMPAASAAASAFRASSSLPKDQAKERAVREFRNRCPDALLPWIDASVVLAGDQAFFPPLLGTGGNDGRLDFSTNFHQRLLEVLDATPKGRARSLAYARDLLAGAETQRLVSAPVGQFDPAASGGRNSSPFGAADSVVNPWAYVLLIEGALLFAASAARRYQHAAGRAAMPFTVFASPDGSASGAAREASRGEVWTPVWTRACTLPEIRQLFGEARASWRGRPAQRAVEFYAATRTLGVARGVDSFVRYGLHQRNGLAFVAVPVERVEVRDNPEVRLVARIEDWASWVRRADTSMAVGGAVRRFDAAHLVYVRDGGAVALARLLAALTALEQAVGRSRRVRESVPVRAAPGARDFLHVLAAAECPELRVAVGIASCATRPGLDPGRVPARSMRQLLLPVDPDGRWRDAPVVAGFGLRPLRRVLADVLAWRSRTAADEADQLTFRGVPTFRYGIPVPAGDLHAFASGRLDEAALDLWLRACLALAWQNVRGTWAAGDQVPLVSTLGMLHPLAEGLADQRAEADTPRLALNPDWAVRLAAGQVVSVHREAARRLRQAGWQAVPAPPRSTVDGAALAAALVPRCRRPRQLMAQYFASPIRTEESPELVEELS